MRLRVLMLSVLVGQTVGLSKTEIESFVAYSKLTSCMTTLQWSAGDDPVTFSFNGKPNHPTFYTNPNEAEGQSYSLTFDLYPTVLSDQRCVPMGQIGYMINGVPLYNPLSAEMIDAVKGEGAETFDACGGHAAPGGRYHYHQQPAAECIKPNGSAVTLVTDGDATLYGVALDGFAIYADPTPPSLDECHGAVVNNEYRYYFTDTYPYIIGCFRGRVQETGRERVQTCSESHEAAVNEMCSCENGKMSSSKAKTGNCIFRWLCGIEQTPACDGWSFDVKNTFCYTRQPSTSNTCPDKGRPPRPGRRER